MARRFCSGCRGNRERGYGDPRCRTQAARARSRDRAAGAGQGAETAGQARSPDRTCGIGRNQGDAAGELCRAQRALGAALRRAARHRRQGSQARARTGAPRRDYPEHRRGLVRRRAQRFDRPHRARRQRARSEFADRAISAAAAACRTRERCNGQRATGAARRHGQGRPSHTPNAPTNSRPRRKSAASR